MKSPPPARAPRKKDPGNAPAPPPNGGKPIGRRVILGMLGLGGLGVLVGSKVQSGIDAALAPLQRIDPTGLSSLIPGTGFQYYTVTDGYPSESDAAYRLTVDGLVDTPTVYTLADLQAMPATRLVRDFQCVTGWRVPKVHWEGVALSVLLDRAGVHPGGTDLRFWSFDGEYTESLTMDQARRPDVIVAYSMLGGPVSRAHGGPVRLYVAPMYGYKSCKWLKRIEVVNRVYPGYWEQEGYDINGWVGRSNGRNDPPT
ncbi:MAG: molybdopterin-dependent oxidoreductase [Acidimicrobiaceae bacterium]|nr:molybdopterin-dependent oxidoreductase [Acidimicrobiaceae bacterium]